MKHLAHALVNVHEDIRNVAGQFDYYTDYFPQRKKIYLKFNLYDLFLISSFLNILCGLKYNK